MITQLRLLLLPFSLVYGGIIAVRNFLYDRQIFRSYTAEVPVISIGNLTMGGTGKSPVTETVCRLLQETHRVAVLSRGYGRTGSGYLEVLPGLTAAETGDEPLQLKKKLPRITVAVGANRQEGIKVLEKQHDVIVLDDAFQHRAVHAGLSILLFDYSAIGHTPWLLPAGNAREPFASRKRADILLVTKAPESIQEAEKARILYYLKPFAHQQVFFSWLEYGELVSLDEKKILQLRDLVPGNPVIVLTGIANPAPLLNELKKYTTTIEPIAFRDHHTFTKKNMTKLAKRAGGKMIITTEKDAQRLLSPGLRDELNGLDLYYLRVSARIQSEEAARFTTSINHYVDSKHPEYHRLY